MHEVLENWFYCEFYDMKCHRELIMRRTQRNHLTNERIGLKEFLIKENADYDHSRKLSYAKPLRHKSP